MVSIIITFNGITLAATSILKCFLKIHQSTSNILSPEFDKQHIVSLAKISLILNLCISFTDKTAQFGHFAAGLRNCGEHTMHGQLS